MGNRDRGVRLRANQSGVELQPNEEHVKDDADVGDDLQVRRDIGREHEVLRGRPDLAE
jgi:hypothetical protein